MMDRSQEKQNSRGGEQRRDVLLLKLLKTPPQPRPKRERLEKSKTKAKRKTK